MTNKYNVSELPKATLHEHIEGTVTPEMAAKLAQRHKFKKPDDFIIKYRKYAKADIPKRR